MKNLKYVSNDTRRRINEFLADPGVRGYAKAIVREGLNKDCVDAVLDSKCAAALLVLACQDINKWDCDPPKASAGQRQDGEPYCDRS